MKLSNKAYNCIKWVLMILVPALVTLIGTLSTIYDFNSELVITTISAIATFIGAITGISCVNYSKSKDVSTED